MHHDLDGLAIEKYYSRGECGMGLRRSVVVGSEHSLVKTLDLSQPSWEMSWCQFTGGGRGCSSPRRLWRLTMLLHALPIAECAQWLALFSNGARRQTMEFERLLFRPFGGVADACRSEGYCPGEAGRVPPPSSASRTLLSVTEP